MGLVNKLKNSKAKGLFYAALLSSTVLVGCKDNANNSNNNDNSNSCENGQLYICQDNKYQLKQNAAPIANAGSDISAYVNDIVLLNGCKSYDPDGGLPSYLWEKISGPDVQINDSTQCLAYFLADREGSLEFRLRVCDNKNACSEDKVSVNITKKIEQVNNRPIAYILNTTPPGFDDACYNNYLTKADRNGICYDTKYDLHYNIKPQLNLALWLIASASDPDGDTLSYEWTQISGPNDAVIASPNSITTQVFFPNALSGDYVFKFKAKDGKDYDEDRTIVHVRNNIPPYVECGIDVACQVNIPCPLPSNDYPAYDPDGEIIKCRFDFGDGHTYEETPQNAPDGNFDCLALHTYTSTGIYTVILTVTDDNNTTSQDSQLAYID